MDLGQGREKNNEPKLHTNWGLSLPDFKSQKASNGILLKGFCDLKLSKGNLSLGCKL